MFHVLVAVGLTRSLVRPVSNINIYVVKRKIGATVCQHSLPLLTEEFNCRPCRNLKQTNKEYMMHHTSIYTKWFAMLIRILQIHLGNFLCLRHRRWCRRHHVFGLSVRTSVRPYLKLSDSVYHYRKTIWLHFGARRSKVKGHRGQLMKFHTLRLLSWYLKNHWRCKNFKLKDSMYHHRKTIWLDFGARRSKVKGHRGQLMKFHTLRLLS